MQSGSKDNSVDEGELPRGWWSCGWGNRHVEVHETIMAMLHVLKILLKIVLK